MHIVFINCLSLIKAICKIYPCPCDCLQFTQSNCSVILHQQSFSDSSAGKESAFNAEDLGLIPRLGRSTGEGKVYPLQCSGLENSMDCTSLEGRKESDTTEQLSPSLFTFIVLTQYFSLLLTEMWVSVLSQEQ